MVVGLVLLRKYAAAGVAADDGVASAPAGAA
jgi:hypothetical protein